MRLDEYQRSMVEENLGLIGKVIKDKVLGIYGIGIFTYDDLFQFGGVGLCKAAATYKPGKAKFSTYAYILIRNAIFDALEYAALRRSHEFPIEVDELPGIYSLLSVNRDENLNQTLDEALSRASGVTAKGIRAIRMQAEGYTLREIGEKMGGASANNVSAWVARARYQILPRAAGRTPSCPM